MKRALRFPSVLALIAISASILAWAKPKVDPTYGWVIELPLCHPDSLDFFGKDAKWVRDNEVPEIQLQADFQAADFGGGNKISGLASRPMTCAAISDEFSRPNPAYAYKLPCRNFGRDVKPVPLIELAGFVNTEGEGKVRFEVSFRNGFVGLTATNPLTQALVIGKIAKDYPDNPEKQKAIRRQAPLPKDFNRDYPDEIKREMEKVAAEQKRKDPTQPPVYPLELARKMKRHDDEVKQILGETVTGEQEGKIISSGAPVNLGKAMLRQGTLSIHIYYEDNGEWFHTREYSDAVFSSSNPKDITTWVVEAKVPGNHQVKGVLEGFWGHLGLQAHAPDKFIFIHDAKLFGAQCLPDFANSEGCLGEKKSR